VGSDLTAEDTILILGQGEAAIGQKKIILQELKWSKEEVHVNFTIDDFQGFKQAGINEQIREVLVVSSKKASHKLLLKTDNNHCYLVEMESSEKVRVVR